MRTMSAAVFHCRMCGHCCQGKGGIVVSPADLTRLAGHLALPEAEVLARYCERLGGKWQLRAGADGFCIFFRPGAGCGVHAGKPAVCRAWPFFRGNIEDAASLAMAKEYCPGIAPEATHTAFAQAGRAYLRAHGLLARDPRCEANALILK